jgi:hypothetical protein
MHFEAAPPRPCAGTRGQVLANIPNLLVEAEGMAWRFDALLNMSFSTGRARTECSCSVGTPCPTQIARLAVGMWQHNCSGASVGSLAVTSFTLGSRSVTHGTPRRWQRTHVNHDVQAALAHACVRSVAVSCCRVARGQLQLRFAGAIKALSAKRDAGAAAPRGAPGRHGARYRHVQHPRRGVAGREQESSCAAAGSACSNRPRSVRRASNRCARTVAGLMASISATSSDGSHRLQQRRRAPTSTKRRQGGAAGEANAAVQAAPGPSCTPSRVSEHGAATSPPAFTSKLGQHCERRLNISHFWRLKMSHSVPASWPGAAVVL